MKPYLALRSNPKLLTDDFSVPDFSSNSVKIFRVDYSFLTQECIDIFEYYSNAKPLNIQLFYTPPNTINKNIHIDGTRYNDMWAINHVIGNENGIMRWYNTDNEIEPASKSGISTRYISFAPEQVTEIDRHAVTGVSLVKIGIPHSIDNPSEQPRWCLSVRPERYHCTYDNMYQKITAQLL